MKYSLRSLIIAAILAILAITAGFLIFPAPSSSVPDFDADANVVGGTLTIDDRFYGGLWSCQCSMSPEEIRQLMKRLSPGKPYSGQLGVGEENVMARINVDMGEGRVVPLVVYWTGHNPAAFSLDGVLYWHDIQVPDLYDEGGRIHSELRKLCESRKVTP